MKIGAIVQARMSSSRLPGKVLKELPYGSGITVLGQIIRRLKRSKIINDIIIATTTEKKDLGILGIAAKEGVKFFKGSKNNVLSRFYLAAKRNNLDVIVRVTSDCPCVDPRIVDSVIKKHIKAKVDYTSNCQKRTFALGLDVEVINFSALKVAYREAKKDYEREHVAPYIYLRPDIFKISSIESTGDLYAPDIRITIDTIEDYVLLCAVFDYLYHKNNCFSAYDIVKLFKNKPWLGLINKRVIHKKVFNSMEAELKEAQRVLKLQGLKRAGSMLKKVISK